MSANGISWKRVQRLNRDMGEQFVHAWTGSSGRWWVCIRHDGTAVEVDTRTHETQPFDGSTTTITALRSRRPHPVDGNEWLTELDRRQSEIVRGGPKEAGVSS